MIVLSCVLVICANCIAGLALILRHLAAMRATTGELQRLSAHVGNADSELAQRIKVLEEKVTLLNNRLQSTR